MHFCIKFQYLGQCAELELDINSCIVSTYIANFMNKYAATDDNDNGSSSSSRLRFLLQLAFDNDNNSGTSSIGTLRRYLQQEITTTTTTTNNNDDECNRPEITEKELRTDMTVANDQCGGSSGDGLVSLLEYEYAITTFLRLFTNVDCWVSLCDGRSNGYFFKSLIANAAQCANVVLANDCVYDSMLDLVLGGQRRVVPEVASSSSSSASSSQSSTSCNDNLPSVEDATASIEYLLLQSKTHCTSVGVNYTSEVWDTITFDLVTIFTSSECWNWGDCDEVQEGITPSTSNVSGKAAAATIEKKTTASFSFVTAMSISLILVAYYYYRFRQHTSDVLLGQEFVVLDDGSNKEGRKKNVNTTICNDEESSSLQYTTLDDGESSLAYSATSVES